MAYDRRRANLLRTERARRVYERLRVIGDGPASFYLRILDELEADPARPAARNTLFHAWRELESGLHDVLAPLVADDAELDTHEKKILAVLRALGIALDDPVAKTWLALVGNQQARAHRSGLRESDPIDDTVRTDWDALEGVLDKVLARFEERYLAAVAAVPRLIATPVPSDADMKTLSRLPQGPALTSFFRGLQHEGWLEPLAEKGAFARPIGRAYGPDGGFALPPWAPAEYLRRLADRQSKRLQRRLMEVVLTTKETDNDIVHVQFTEIAVLAPPLMASAWAEREAAWLARQTWIHSLLGERLARLAVRLFDEGAIDVARALAAALLEPGADTRFSESDADAYLHRSPRTRLGEEYDYEHVLGILRPGLREGLGVDVVRFVSDLLEGAVSLGDVVEKETGRDDRSTWWWPTIEDTDQTVYHRGIRETLVQELRDTASEIATRDPAVIPDLVGALEGRGLPIFDRIALHVLRVAPGAPNELIAAHIRDPQNRRRATWHEWALLVRERFDALADAERDALIEEFFRGPDAEGIRARFETFEGRPPTDEELEARLDTMRMQVLQLVAERLPEEARIRYDALRAKRGELRRPELLHYTTPLAAPALPVEVGSFGSDINAWIAFARDFTPAPTLGEDGHETASRTLAAAVQADPTTFAAAAMRFAGLRPPYVRAIFNGLEQAARAGAAFAWPEVLALAEWVLGQPYQAQPETRFEEIGWAYTYHALVFLLRSAFTEGALELSIEERERIWRIITALATSPEPTTEQEARSGARPRDLASFALTAARPRALSLAVDYARWLDRRLPRADDAPARSFATMAEVAALLEEHLDPTRDPSVAVRSVYGERFGSLLYLDRAWLETHRPEIFPTDPAWAPLRDAAWESFLDATNASGTAFELLRAEYTKTSARTGATAEYRWTNPPAVSLLLHLLVLAALGVDGADALLDAALANAPGEVRHGAFELFGRSVRASAPKTEVAARLQALFDRRLDIAERAADRTPYTGELATIGLWCDAPPGIDEAWLLGAVARVSRLVGRIEAPHWVTRRLAAAAARIPGDAIDALDALVTAFRADAWRLGTWMTDITRIIRLAHAAGDAPHKRAEAVANRLAVLGFADEMRALLVELAVDTDPADEESSAAPVPPALAP